MGSESQVGIRIHPFDVVDLMAFSNTSSVFVLKGKRILKTSWSPAGVNSSVTRWEGECVL